uniref:Uncharacterized protein n=1 Tax=Oryza meridionalis TaxID=40149 RepID=A0A0E0E7T8_9ORYZ
MDSDGHPSEFIIHVIEDLAPPPPPPPARAAAPPRILPAAAAFQPRLRPSSEANKTIRTVLFIFKVICFALIALASSTTIYSTVHPNPGQSIADQRLDVQVMCGFILAVGVLWLLVSYFSLIIHDEEQGLDPLFVD